MRLLLYSYHDWLSRKSLLVCFAVANVLTSLLIELQREVN